MVKYVYIDDEFYERINENSYTRYDWSDHIDIDDLRKIIEGLPTADVEPVRHGKWIRIDDRDYWKCSCCQEENAYAYALNDDSLILQDRYCPNCGAKMEE